MARLSRIDPDLDYSRVEVAADARHRPMKFIIARNEGDSFAYSEQAPQSCLHEIATLRSQGQGLAVFMNNSG